MISFFVPGVAAPQGSKRHVGRGVLVESSKKVGPWRKSVGREATVAMRGQEMLVGPVRVDLSFVFDRPKGHYGTGKNSGKVKTSSPLTHITYPDLDKLIRSTCDALTDIVWDDDSHIVYLSAAKRYVDSLDSSAGCWIRVTKL